MDVDPPPGWTARWSASTKVLTVTHDRIVLTVDASRPNADLPKLAADLKARGLEVDTVGDHLVSRRTDGELCSWSRKQALLQCGVTGQGSCQEACQAAIDRLRWPSE